MTSSTSSIAEVDLAEKNAGLNQILQSGIRSLDLTESQHTKAVSEYKAIGNHLSKLTWFCDKYSPDIFPQGSMDLGTCVRPIGQNEFDLDVVVLMTCTSITTLLTLMDDLERALKSYVGKHTKIKRMDRCFRLDYPGDFHLDLVPACPDPSSTNPTAILLPNRGSKIGTPTDPRAFKELFEEAKKREIIFLSANEKIANMSKATVAPAPQRTTHKNKKNLQFVIQIFKRHRDVYFDKRDDAPSSAIIAALATASYLGHQDLYEAVDHALNTMKNFVRPTRPRVPNERYWQEDFADRWGILPPDREAAFDEWYAQAKEDFDKLSQFKIASARETLRPVLGQDTITAALSSFDNDGISALRKNKTLGIIPVLGSLTSTAMGAPAAKGTSFYGN